MKVILKQDIKGSGKKGDILDVNDGYAKNFLLKKGFAELASSSAINELEMKNNAKNYHRAEEIKQITSLANQVNGTVIELPIKLGENGKTFGSITSKEIASKLQDLSFNVDKKKILLKEPLKFVGDYKVQIRFIENVHATITVKVIAQ